MDADGGDSKAVVILWEESVDTLWEVDHVCGVGGEICLEQNSSGRVDVRCVQLINFPYIRHLCHWSDEAVCLASYELRHDQFFLASCHPGLNAFVIEIDGFTDQHAYAIRALLDISPHALRFH